MTTGPDRLNRLLSQNDLTGIDFVGPIPAEIQPGFTFAGAVGSKAAEPDAARALIKFLSSPEAAPAITKAGLTPMGK